MGSWTATEWEDVNTIGGTVQRIPTATYYTPDPGERVTLRRVADGKLWEGKALRAIGRGQAGKYAREDCDVYWRVRGDNGRVYICPRDLIVGPAAPTPEFEKPILSDVKVHKKALSPAFVDLEGRLAAFAERGRRVAT